jgi:ribosome-associated toxin RatA of RatAB toxin-antitoxin module
MRQVTIEAHVPGAGADAVFDKLTDFARYPDFTDAVREVSVRPAADGGLDSDWAVNFRNGILRWSEHDVIDPVGQTIAFTQTAGDFERFDGSWWVIQVDDGVVVRFEAAFDLGMPSLAPIIDPIAEHALVENIQRILRGLLDPRTTFPALAGAEA